MEGAGRVKERKGMEKMREDSEVKGRKGKGKKKERKC